MQKVNSEAEGYKHTHHERQNMAVTSVMSSPREPAPGVADWRSRAELGSPLDANRVGRELMSMTSVLTLVVTLYL